MTRLTRLERLALLAVAAFLLVLGFEVGGRDRWWGWPASILLVLAAAAIVGGVAIVTVRQAQDRSGGGDRDDA